MGNERLYITTVTLEKFKLVASQRLSKKFALDATIDFSFYENFADEVAFQIIQAVYGQRIGEVITVKFPANWKEAVKERFAPAWFLRRWPILYNETIIDLAEIYPRFRPPDTESRVVNMSTW